MDDDIATDHRGMRVLGLEECLQRLGRARVARVAFVANGEAEVLPVAIGLDGSTVVFRTTWGAKLEAAMVRAPVTVEVDDFDGSGEGWSVVVKGTASMEYDRLRTEHWESLVPRWLSDEGETFWVAVSPEEISGRELVSSP
jgi:nitroimidazol reductase NimA-like FMN-containing flavoprotein (pyridoxamine 5'-phosphate oxidase superfamily)